MLNVTAGGRGGTYRFAGTPPIVVSPLDPDNIYNTSNVVHRSSDGGQTFEVISPDLTGGAKSRELVNAGAPDAGSADYFRRLRRVHLHDVFLSQQPRAW